MVPSTAARPPAPTALESPPARRDLGGEGHRRAPRIAAPPARPTRRARRARPRQPAARPPLAPPLAGSADPSPAADHPVPPRSHRHSPAGTVCAAARPWPEALRGRLDDPRRALRPCSRLRAGRTRPHSPPARARSRAGARPQQPLPRASARPR